MKVMHKSKMEWQGPEVAEMCKLIPVPTKLEKEDKVLQLHFGSQEEAKLAYKGLQNLGHQL